MHRRCVCLQFFGWVNEKGIMSQLRKMGNENHSTRKIILNNRHLSQDQLGQERSSSAAAGL